jgi:KDO2-lipid IV(A) lauroyltransferase
MAVKTGAFFGGIASKIIVKRFKLTVDNIQKAFPDKSVDEVKKIALGSWRNMGMVAAEFMKVIHMNGKSVFEKCRIENTEQVKSRLNSGKGVLLHLGHLTNWEIIGIALPLFLGLKSAAIARHIRNPYLDKWIISVRSRFGTEIISHRNLFFPCIKMLKKGWSIGILTDQNMPANAIFAPFLGRYCAITPLTALLSLKTQTPIFPLKVTRENNGILRAVFESPIMPDKNYSEQNVRKLVTKLNHKIEEWIKANPPMWLWAHNRWKREREAVLHAKKKSEK